ncbi:Dihydroanticapsin 7-dehydrogenase [Micromonospora sp. MH33]|uniref:SDR family NAD(P)-dependent oxidoreductase n=1 Tax=Micromonospora sp. MH33 TaxID=1945509 RepID=UPI000D2841A9|nr:SDR family NAD(P)-dependent oxidoreductase [Micromonospora sp. MH33]PSK63731.1 Dihydroanticapsin 7-dehydrogenase [Micromonospora sp. MH33]
MSVGSYVVTGGGRGVGRAVVERLVADGGTVVVIERDEAALDWLAAHPAADRLRPVAGDAADEEVTGRAADVAEAAAPLAGWVNNAAVFRDATLHRAPAGEVFDLIAANLRPAVVGAGTAVRRFLAAGTGGAIVNVSSHQLPVLPAAATGSCLRPASTVRNDQAVRPQGSSSSTGERWCRARLPGTAVASSRVRRRGDDGTAAAVPAVRAGGRSRPAPRCRHAGSGLPARSGRRA